MFNIIVGKIGASILITILQKTFIKSALKKSFKQMEIAETSGKVPSILCDDVARFAMQQRLINFADDLKKSTMLNPFAKFANYAGAILYLSNHVKLLKLGMTAYKETVEKPVFIVSMPRTATTVLHRTLATDTSRWRAFTLADMISPIPPVPRSDHTKRKLLAEKVQKNFINKAKRIFPGWNECLETMHSMVPDQVDEDLGIYDSGVGFGFQDTLMLLYPEQDARNNPLETSNFARYRYAWLDMVMRIHQAIDPENNNTWIMKDPNHTAYLPQLLEQFPDARFIFTHRTPAEIIPSVAKTFLVFCCISVIPGKPNTTSLEWGQHALLKTKFFLNGVIEFTKKYKMDENHRIDFLFTDLAPNMVDCIEQIYKKFFGTTLNNTIKRDMQAYLDNHQREKKGNQPRSLEDFHLTEQDVVFEEYSKLFLEKT